MLAMLLLLIDQRKISGNLKNCTIDINSSCFMYLETIFIRNLP